MISVKNVAAGSVVVTFEVSPRSADAPLALLVHTAFSGIVHLQNVGVSTAGPVYDVSTYTTPQFECVDDAAELVAGMGIDCGRLLAQVSYNCDFDISEANALLPPETFVNDLCPVSCDVCTPTDGSQYDFCGSGCYTDQSTGLEMARMPAGSVTSTSELADSDRDAILDLQNASPCLANVPAEELCGWGHVEWPACRSWGQCPNGIGCRAGRVTQIQLKRCGIKELPASFGSLSALTDLDVRYNDLQSLPNSFPNLIALAFFSAGYNRLQVLPDLPPNLEIINLIDNELTGLPSTIGQLVRLKFIAFIDNRFRSVPGTPWLPDSFGDLTQIRLLEFSGNAMSYIPSSIAGLTEIRWFRFWNCAELLALPLWIGRLYKMQALALTGSKITAVPETIGNLTSLSYLDLSDNIGITELPDAIRRLVHLVTLIVSGCSISALPNSITEIQTLGWLHLDRNVLSDLPPLFGNLGKRLVVLDVTANLLQVSRVSFICWQLLNVKFNGVPFRIYLRAPPISRVCAYYKRVETLSNG
jgi:Leucine-rich repeat (LRR) protein